MNVSEVFRYEGKLPQNGITDWSKQNIKYQETKTLIRYTKTTTGNAWYKTSTKSYLFLWILLILNHAPQCGNTNYLSLETSIVSYLVRIQCRAGSYLHTDHFSSSIIIRTEEENINVFLVRKITVVCLLQKQMSVCYPACNQTNQTALHTPTRLHLSLNYNISTTSLTKHWEREKKRRRERLIERERQFTSCCLCNISENMTYFVKTQNVE